MYFTIASSHPCLAGHFPGNPVVPGVVVLDQVIAAIEHTHGPLPSALRLPQVKFLQPLLPEQEARIELHGDAPQWRFKVWRGDMLLASGDVICDEGYDTP